MKTQDFDSWKFLHTTQRLQQYFGHTIRENIGDYLICFFFLSLDEQIRHHRQ